MLGGLIGQLRPGVGGGPHGKSSSQKKEEELYRLRNGVSTISVKFLALVSQVLKLGSWTT